MLAPLRSAGHMSRPAVWGGEGGLRRRGYGGGGLSAATQVESVLIRSCHLPSDENGWAPLPADIYIDINTPAPSPETTCFLQPHWNIDNAPRVRCPPALF